MNSYSRVGRTIRLAVALAGWSLMGLVGCGGEPTCQELRTCEGTSYDAGPDATDASEGGASNDSQASDTSSHDSSSIDTSNLDRSSMDGSPDGDASTDSAHDVNRELGPSDAPGIDVTESGGQGLDAGVDGSARDASDAPSALDADAACPPGSQTFDFTGAAQAFQVPNCVTSIQVTATGAEGGRSMSQFGQTYSGGKGGRVQATLTVVPGTWLQIMVGGMGSSCLNPAGPTVVNGGFNGGGATTCDAFNGDGSGGGASDIRAPNPQGSYPLEARIVVAGGGGGGGVNGSRGSLGGAGGGLIGGTGDGDFTDPGRGGTQSMGGAGGYRDLDSGSAQSGSFGLGGSVQGATAAAGGGGWYGGGAAWAGGGGGGSSYVTPIGSSNVDHRQGNNSGNGRIVIQW
jgi:hypothetical protein